MSKRIKLILIITLSIVVYFLVKKDDLENIQFSNNINEVITPVAKEVQTADFNMCEKDFNFSTVNKSGKAYLRIIEKQTSDCIIETGYESELGSFSNKCRIPLTLGIVEFENGNFEKISQYCQLDSTGTGILDLN